ncbi:MAG: site-specific integrase [Rhodocyclales bacterium GT-UBC]|nr:MAG: site-specific integrase [Rhodocyclales bacterium GT-UBC]
MASIRERNGRWQARVTRNGFMPETRSFDSHDAAVKWARAIEAEIDKGVFVSLKEAERTTLKDILNRYSDEVSPLKRATKDDQAKLRWLSAQKIACLSLANLTPKAIAHFRDARLSKVSAGTVLRDLAVLRSVINHARREWGMAIENPVEKIRKPPAPPHRDRVLNHDEEQRLLNALTPSELRDEAGRFAKGTRDPWLKPMVILAIESAMRRGELLALEWRHLDLTRRTAFLPTTKNGHSRHVPLSSRAIRTIQELPHSIDGRVFPIARWTVEQVFERATKIAGLTGLHFHDLRHTAATRLAEKVPNVIELAAITGHTNVGMLKRYYHPAAEALARKLG